jgi:hypothetical protein
MCEEFRESIDRIARTARKMYICGSFMRSILPSSSPADEAYRPQPVDIDRA